MWWLLLALIYFAFDVNYGLRMAATLGILSRIQRRNRTKLTEPVATYSICLPQDADVLLRHMSNARYLRELDFARVHWYGQSKIHPQLWNALQSSTMIRYRRMIAIGQLFRIESRLVWWDKRSVFLEQKFVTLADGFVRAVATSRQVLVDVNVEQLLGQFEECRVKPERPAEVGHWMDANAASSQQLRPDRETLRDYGGDQGHFLIK